MTENSAILMLKTTDALNKNVEKKCAFQALPEAFLLSNRWILQTRKHLWGQASHQRKPIVMQIKCQFEKALTILHQWF